MKFFAGIVVGAVALGVAHLVAGVIDPASSPLLAVGDVVIEATPEPLKQFSIRTFGSNNKTVLIAVMLLLLVLIAGTLGRLAQRRMGLAIGALGGFGVIGVAAAVTRPDAGSLALVPSVAGAAAGVGALLLLYGRSRRIMADRETASDAGELEEAGNPDGDDQRPGLNRRAVIAGAGVAVVSGGIGIVLSDRSGAEAARQAIRLPKPVRPAPALPRGADLRIPGLARYVTPNGTFYRVDTTLLVPQVDPADWKLRIHGMVDRPLEITYADLLRRPFYEHDITLTCVSNEVGGQYAGNARWLGARLPALLREAGLQSGADMLLSISEDGWTCGTPVDVVMDGREVLLAVAMNGAVLPADHGFPVRMVVPGLYGYVSATKWIREIKVTRFADEQAYWTTRGWAERAPIKTMSRIDVPTSKVSAGRVKIAGVAWAQHKGVDAVEVQIGDGEWAEATLAATAGPDTWRQWVYEWDAEPGSHRVQVRATDAAGYTQTAKPAPPAPDGATGWHTRTVEVT